MEPSRNDKIARQMVENNIKVIDNRYEIPVPFNMEVVEQLRKDYQSALD